MRPSDLYHYSCYGQDISSHSPIDILSDVEVAVPARTAWEIIWEKPRLPRADWQLHSAGGQRDRERIKVYSAEFEGQTFHRVCRNPRRWGELEIILDLDQKIMWFAPPPTIDARDIQSLFVGAILGSALSLSGEVCLHASAVEIDGEAILFLGRSGAGKSTNAMNLIARHGGTLITDDIGLLSVEDGRLCVWPGYRHLRIMAQKAHDSGFNESAIARQVYGHLDKSYLQLEGAVEPTPVKTAVVLDRLAPDQELRLSSPSGPAAFMQSAKNVYAGEMKIHSELVRAEADMLSKLVWQADFIDAKIPHNNTSLNALSDEVLSVHRSVEAACD